MEKCFWSASRCNWLMKKKCEKEHFNFSFHSILFYLAIIESTSNFIPLNRAKVCSSAYTYTYTYLFFISYKKFQVPFVVWAFFYIYFFFIFWVNRYANRIYLTKIGWCWLACLHFSCFFFWLPLARFMVYFVALFTCIANIDLSVKGFLL